MNKKINKLRKKINNCDKKIIHSLLKRINIVTNIKKVKKQYNIPIYDKNREEVIFNNIKKYCRTDSEFEYIKNVYLTILDNSKKIQQ